MSKITIVEGNSNDKDNVRALMVKGERGYSAYEIAVQNGYEGTEAEWKDSFLNAENYYNKSEIDESQTNQNNVINKKAYYFNSVAEIKAYNLQAGDMAITLGYYEANDGGGATYKITDTESELEYQETLNNGLYATLIINNSEINVKQLGAKGDGITNDDLAFERLKLLSVKKLIIPYGTYLVDTFDFNSLNIEGNNSTINCKFETNELVKFASNSIINNLHINCINTVREWKRIELKNVSFIEFNNCKFSGFIQEQVISPSTGLNVWALYFRECHDIRVINCEFENNNFQDILIEFDTSNLYFENLQRNDELFDGVVVDIEPSQNNICKNITFINCNLNDLETFEYFNNTNQLKNIKILDSRIGKFRYHGGDLTIENCSIELIDVNNFLPNAGILNLINSVNFSNNLIKDNYFATLGNGTSGDWITGYISGSWNNFINRTKDDTNGIVLSLNKDNISGMCAINSKKYNCTSGDIYLLKTLCKAKYPSGTTSASPSKQLRIIFFDSNDTEINRYIVSINRTSSTETDFKYQSNIFKAPANSSYFIITYITSDQTSLFSLHLINASLYKLTCTENTNNINDLPMINNLKFKYTTKPSDTSKYPNYFVGDKIEYETLSTYIGAVCTANGNTWKDFGSIEP